MKTNIFYLSWLLALSSCLISCSFFLRSDILTGDKADTANFIVQEIQGHVVATRLNGLPEEIQISHKACFKDLVYQDNRLPGGSLFKIHFFEHFQKTAKSTEPTETKTEAKTSPPADSKKPKCSKSNTFLFSDEVSCIEVETDSNGCISWIELYPYHPQRESVWYRYARAFEGQGVNKGLKTVPMALNPWLSLDATGSALQLVDLRHRSIAKKGQLIDLKDPDIPQCRFCAETQNKKDCDICHHKKNSLSAVMAHFEQKSSPPRLWMDKTTTHISQEYIVINDKLSPEHLNMLKQFKVCLSPSDTNCDPPGRFFKVRLHIPLKIQVQNYRGESEYPLLNRGQYALKAYLFLKSETGEHILLNRDMGFKSAHLFKGGGANLRADFYFHVPYEHYGLPAFLALKVQQARKAGESVPLCSTDPALCQIEGATNPKALLRVGGGQSVPLCSTDPALCQTPRVGGGQRVPLCSTDPALCQAATATPQFLPFEAVFPFDNNLRTVVGKKDLYIEKSALSFYKSTQREPKSLLESYQLAGSWEKGQDLGFRKAGWEIQLKRLRFSDVDLETCPNLVERTIRYVGEVCIVDPLTGEAVSDTSISIQRQNIEVKSDGSFEQKQAIALTPYKAEDLSTNTFKEGEPQDLKLNAINNTHSMSDTSGCLRWVDKLSHKWYNKEKYFIRRMIFSKQEWGFAGEKMIAINPWHWGFVFFQDISQLGHSAIRTNPQKAEPPRVVLHDFRSLFPDLIYTIDRWLGINLFQNLLFLFRIRIDRPDNVSVGLGGQRPSTQEARRGYYTVRFTLVKSHTEEAGGKGNQVVNDHTYRQQKIEDGNHNQGWLLGRKGGQSTGQMMNTNLEYITHYDTHVQVRDSMVNAYANFLFDLNEFVFIGSNSRLIVQLWPTDPKHYVYKPNTCEIDPQKSKFKPFHSHDLVTPAFMGTFVPGDQRNWNIFRAISDSLSLKRSKELDVLSLNMDKAQTEDFIQTGQLTMPSDMLTTGGKNIIALNNISHNQWDRFIKNSKKRGEEHKLWTKLQTHWTVRANSFSEEARSFIRAIGSPFEDFQTLMESFLRQKPSTQALSLFQQKRNQLLESIDLLQLNVSTVLKGTRKDSKAYLFFQNVQKVFAQSKQLLTDSSQEPLAMRMDMDIIRKQFLSLVNSVLTTPLSSQELKVVLNKEASEEPIKPLETKNRWFKQGIDFPKQSTEWSGFNMNLFAKDRGLKVITMESPLLDTFIQDLNTSADIHNSYHKEWNSHTEKDNIYANINSASKPLDFESHGSNIQQTKDYLSFFWDNFELMEGDSYKTITDKTKKMYLPAIDKAGLTRVLEDGIHTGNVQTVEVMTFLHSLCGFWFNDFYDKYLAQDQLDTLFENHMDHFRYYKGTLDYLSNDQGSFEQYQELYRAMEQYNLTSIQQSVLKKQNPFSFLQSATFEVFPFLQTYMEEESKRSSFLTDNLYKITPLAWTLRFLTPSSISTSPYVSGPAVVRAEHKAFRISETKRRDNTPRHPYFKCIANPFNFFHTEKKIIVGDIGSDYSDLKYEYGLTFSYNLQKAFDYAYSTQWSMSRSFSASLGTGFTAFGNLDRIIPPLRVVNPFIEFNGVKLGGDFGTSRSDADSNRRQHSLRFSDESMYFQVNKSVISIRLKNFRHCLVVRAKNQAFEGYSSSPFKVWKEELEENFVNRIPYIKSGLMLCSEDIDAKKDLETPFYIKEDYYYLYQLMPMDRGQFQNPLSFRNRPYIMSVRGRTEMEKLGFLLHSFVEGDKKEGVEDYNPFWYMTNPYNTSPRVAEGTREMIEQAKIWDKTGFYPGVYDVQYDNEHYFLREPSRINNISPKEAKKKKPKLERLGDWLYHKNPWGYIRFDETPPTPFRTEP